MRATGIRLVATLFVANKFGVDNILVLGALLVKKMHDGLLGLLHHLLVTSSGVQGDSRIRQTQLIVGHRSQQGLDQHPGIWIHNWPAGIHIRQTFLIACEEYGICCLMP